MNQAFIIGRMTKNPEERTTKNGKTVANFSVAVNRRMDRERTDFFNIVAFGKTAELCVKYLVKGQRVSVRGEMQIDSYTDKNGVKRDTFGIVADEIEFLDKPNGASAPVIAPTEPAVDENGWQNIDDDELPF